MADADVVEEILAIIADLAHGWVVQLVVKHVLEEPFDALPLIVALQGGKKGAVQLTDLGRG